MKNNWPGEAKAAWWGLASYSADGMRYVLITLLCFLSLTALGQPKISFSFDDGSTGNRPGYTLEEWNELLLKSLREAEVQAIFFVTGKNLQWAKGKYLLHSWDQEGHSIANHTWTHPNFNNPQKTGAQFQKELLTTDSLIRDYEHYLKLFRFPYLKEGSSPPQVEHYRQVLKAAGYRNGYVTIDASDWYIESRLIKRLKQDPHADLSKFRQFYLDHLWERANFYEQLSYKLTGRHINHVMLLHHNLAAALFLDDLIDMFKQKGWQIMSADEAYKDPIFQTQPKYAGESLIWALAKDAGLYEHLLRYPAEDSRYEKEKMDRLGL